MRPFSVAFTGIVGTVLFPTLLPRVFLISLDQCYPETFIPVFQNYTTKLRENGPVNMPHKGEEGEGLKAAAMHYLVERKNKTEMGRAGHGLWGKEFSR